MSGEHCKIFPLIVCSKQPGSGQTPISAAISEGCGSGSQSQKVCWHDSRERVEETAAQEETGEKC